MADRPNVIVILCDDLGYGDIGCFGSTRNRTPRLDRMADEGMRLTDFCVASSVCSPSRAALLTGCYPKRIGLDSGERFMVLLTGDHLGLSPAETTIADLLGSSGYRTKAIGKWHLGDQEDFLPLNHGFDSYFGLPYSNDMGADVPFGAREFFDYPPLPLLRGHEVIETEPNQAGLTYRYTAEALEFIQTSAAAKEPFFLYFAHMYVHTPIYAPIRYLAGSENGPYGAAVQHVDDALGSILDALDALGIADDTIVVFTSDNGAWEGDPAASNGPLRGGKGTTWEGGFRVPCIVRWPGVVPAGTECHELTTSMDLMPTIASLTGIPLPGDRLIDGRDISPLLRGVPGRDSPEPVFAYYGAGDHTLQAVRRGRWKLHLLLDELYDLETDVGESANVFGGHPDVVAELLVLAESLRAELGDAHTGAPGTGTRPPGWVENATTLTSMEDFPPLLRAFYD